MPPQMAKSHELRHTSRFNWRMAECLGCSVGASMAISALLLRVGRCSCHPVSQAAPAVCTDRFRMPCGLFRSMPATRHGVAWSSGISAKALPTTQYHPFCADHTSPVRFKFQAHRRASVVCTGLACIKGCPRLRRPVRQQHIGCNGWNSAPASILFFRQWHPPWSSKAARTGFFFHPFCCHAPCRAVPCPQHGCVVPFVGSGASLNAFAFVGGDCLGSTV